MSTPRPPFSLRRLYRRWFFLGHSAQLLAGLILLLTPLYGQYQPDTNGNPVWNSPDPEPLGGPDTSDYDGDNLPGWYETYLGTDPYNPDTDSDLITDRDEVFVTHSNPTLWDTNGNGNSDMINWLLFDVPNQDYDGDGLSNISEINSGVTSPLLSDTDGDGFSDSGDPYPNDNTNYSSTNNVSWYGEVLNDTDNDGTPNWQDPAPYPPADTDSDGIPDSSDPYPNDNTNYCSLNNVTWYNQVLNDADSDGTPNWQDSEPYGPPLADADLDGIPDTSDPFPNDNTNYSSTNGVAWYNDVLGDADSDGTTNWQDPEPYGPPPPTDSDGDGIPDGEDPYPNDNTNYSTSNGISWGSSVLGDDDSDGTPNWQDSEPYGPITDSDGDGIADSEDPFPTDSTNYSNINNVTWYGMVNVDDDSDGVPNGRDYTPYPPLPNDVDADGIEDGLDPFPYDYGNYSTINSSSWGSAVLGDNDGDTIPNWQDVDPLNPQDTDGDGLRLNQEIALGTSDEDVDCDDDGLTDYEEAVVYSTANVSPLNANSLSPLYSDYYMVDTSDSDGGGIPNRIEQFYGMNPSDPWDDTNGDLDGDGTKNLKAYQQGWNLLLSYARDYDRDNDGMTNVWEIAHSLDPNDPKDAYDDPDADYLFNVEEEDANLEPALADTDGNPANGDDFKFAFQITSASLALNHNDLESDGREYNDDWDGDGYDNITEIYAGTDPRNPGDHPGSPEVPETSPPAALPILANADPSVSGGPSGGAVPDKSFTSPYIGEPSDAPKAPPEIPELKCMVWYDIRHTYTPYTVVPGVGRVNGDPIITNFNTPKEPAFAATAQQDHQEPVYSEGGHNCGCNGSPASPSCDCETCTCSIAVETGAVIEIDDRFYMEANFEEPLPQGVFIKVYWRKTTALIDQAGPPVIEELETITVEPGETAAGDHPAITAELGQRVTYELYKWEVDPEKSDPPAPPGPIPTSSASIADSAGPRFRRIGMDGKPMRDSFPDPEDEYKRRQSATYVDAYNATLRHSMTDASARPAPGTHLGLAVRRDYAEETWSDISGVRLDERPDRPFGAGFTSNICAGVTVEKLTRQYNSSVPGTYLNPVRFTATVVDEQGSVQRFKWNKASQQWIHSREERNDVLTSLNTLTSTWDTNGNPENFVLTKFRGGQCVYERTPGAQTFASNRRDMKESLVQMQYSRMTVASDRRGQVFTYHYGSNDSLVANRITSKIGGGEIRVSMNGNGLVQSVASNTDTITTFTYGVLSAGSTTVPVLATVTKDGETTSYTFGTVTEVDPTPLPPDPDNPLDGPEMIHHVMLTSVTEPRGRQYSFTQYLDSSSYYEQIYIVPLPNTPSLKVRQQIGRPHRVSRMSGPEMNATIACSLSTYVSLDGAMSISAGTNIEGTAGNYAYSFGELASITSPPDTEELWDLHYANLAVCSFSTMTISSSLGAMTFEFDPANGQNLVKFTDLNGGQTEWKYEFGKDLPFKQINPLGQAQTYTYDTKENLLTVLDARGVKKEYVRNSLTGLPMWVNVSDSHGLLYQREVGYETGAHRETFARQEIVRALHPELGERDLLYRVERDERGNITREVADPGGLALETKHDYSPRDLLLRTIDARGHTTRHAYDVRGNRTRTVHPDGSDRVWQFDAGSNLILEKDEEGNVTFHAYDNMDRRVRTVVDLNGNDLPDGRGTDLVQEWAYNGAHDVIWEVDPKGIETSHSYTGDTMRTSTTRDGLTSHFGYGFGSMRTIWDDAKPTQVEDPRGAVVGTVYDALRRPISVTTSDGGTTATDYDAGGNPVMVMDPLGQVTTTEYDGMNRVLKVTFPGNLTQTTTYNSQGKPITVTDVMGRVTRSIYDDAGRPVKVEQPAVTLPNGATAIPTLQNTYDAVGNVVAVTDTLGRVAETRYDSRNRAIETIAPPAYDATTGTLRRAHTTTTYDRLSRVTATTDPFGQVTTKVYDRASRLLETILPPVSVNGGAAQQLKTRSVYDANGNVLEVYDTANRKTTNEYDLHNRLIKTTDPASQVTEFGYDGAGNRTSVKDPKGNITTWTYDDLNRVLTESTPVGVIVSHEYDALNKTRTVDAKGQVLTYHYDNRHRLTEMKMFVDAQAATPHNVRAYAYDHAGSLLSVTESADATLNVSYTYDALGRTLSETSRGFTHSYEYDLAGNRVKTTYGTGRVVHHEYDGVNRLSSLIEAGRATSWHYDLAGRCVAVEQGNGQVQVQSYDAHGRLVQRALYDEAVEGAVMSVGIAYDATGNVVRQEERWNRNASGAMPESNRTTTMGYDAASRLTSEIAVQHSNGSKLTTAYEYDAASNRTKKKVTWGNATAGDTSTYTYNALNQLTGFEERDSQDALRKTVGYTYDANGNRATRTQGGIMSHTYSWDWNNRLSEVLVNRLPQPEIHRYGYDYRMRRTTRQELSNATAITYSGGVSVAEYRITNVPAGTLQTEPQVEFQRGPDMGGGVGGLLYSLRSGEAKFNLSNGRGDIVAQSDSTGMLTWTASYEAYGKRPMETGGNADRQRANSKEEDPTGLLNEGFRYRDLETGTWLSRDPAGFVDGPNLYAYVRQNPWSRFDPDGLNDTFGWNNWFADWVLPDPVGSYREAGRQLDIAAGLDDERSSVTDRIGGAFGYIGNGVSCVVDCIPGVGKAKTMLVKKLAGEAAQETTEALIKQAVKHGDDAVEKATKEIVEEGAGGASKNVVIDTDAVFGFKDAKKLLKPGEVPVKTATTDIELRMLERQGRMKMPGVAKEIPTIPDLGYLDTIINVRGKMQEIADRTGKKIKGNMVGDGRNGATAIDGGMPLITNDKLLRQAVEELGGEVRK